jgi:hypothetical protein
MIKKIYIKHIPLFDLLPSKLSCPLFSAGVCYNDVVNALRNTTIIYGDIYFIQLHLALHPGRIIKKPDLLTESLNTL